jgi:YebC/PmpR family DNA-binding regulatory protein
MSGHSKWSTIKRKKGKADAARGKIFTRLIREITVAAKQGGGDETSNTQLRSAVSAARAANMPAANIDKAIKRGTGELPGVTYEEAIYEGYGPGGVALMLDVLTDNKNRTVAELRHILSKHGGSLGEAGCVAWMFNKKGIFTIPTQDVTEDELMDVALEAGAEDILQEDENFEIITTAEDFGKVHQALQDKGVQVDNAEVTMHPQSTVKVDGKQAENLLKLMDALEEQDDIQNVYSNFDIDAELLEQFEQG